MTSVKLPPDDVGATLMRFDGIRGHRYAEIDLFGGDAAGQQVGSIYNTVGLNDPTGTGDTCPQQIWDRIDPDSSPPSTRSSGCSRTASGCGA